MSQNACFSKAMLVSESGPFLTLGSGTFSARNKNLSPLLNRNIPLISGHYGLRNHFWLRESGFLMKKIEKKGPNFLGPLLPILRLTFFKLFRNFWKFCLKKNYAYSFSIGRVFRAHVCSSVGILKLKYGQFLYADVWLRFWNWSLFKLVMLNLLSIFV